MEERTVKCLNPWDCQSKRIYDVNGAYRTLDAGNALEGNGARPSHAGNGYSDTGQMYTLNTIEQHGVCYSVDCRNLKVNREKSGTLQAKENGGFSYNYLNPVLMENNDERPINERR